MDERCLPAWAAEPLRLREAIVYTSTWSGFTEQAIEKDLYCSVLLSQLKSLFDHAGLVFKGGTAISKVYAQFHRLSEDLDFVVSVAVDAVRSRRRTLFAPVKNHLESLASTDPWRTVATSVRGFNESMQYSVEFRYVSCVSGTTEPVFVEVSLREPVIEPSVERVAETLLLDPRTRKKAIPPIPVAVMTEAEAYAEKVRAALCRREPAIRDFYDLLQAVDGGLIDLNESRLRDLIRRKIAIPGNAPPDFSPDRRERLRGQVATRLQPVLRQEDFDRFDFNRVMLLLSDLELQLS